MSGPRLAVIGSLNADLTLIVGRLPGPGETVLSSAPGTVGFGGKGGNQAAAAAAFGADVTMIGRVGDDDVGEQIRADLVSRGVDVSRVRVTPGARSGGATIAVDPAGENLILVDPGANGALVPGDIDPDALDGAGAVLLQLEIPLATVAAAASKASAPVVLNPAPAAPLGPDLLADVDVLVPNRTELALLAGAAPPSGLAATAALARKLRGGLDVVVTLGADGALVVPGSGGPAAHIAAPAITAVAAGPLRRSTSGLTSAAAVTCGVNESSGAAGASIRRRRSAAASRAAAQPATQAAASHEIRFMSSPIREASPF